MPTFPLLRLPGLILFDVFKSLNIEEKIKLSLCSKKVSIQINNARLYSQKVIVDLDMKYQDIEGYSENIKNAFVIINRSTGTINNPDIPRCQIEEHTVPVISFAKGITAFWENDQEGFLSVIRYILKIFRCKISISEHYKSGSFVNTISELLNLQVEFKKLHFYFYGSKDENLFWNQISNKFGLVEDLSILTDEDPNVRPVLTSWPHKYTIMNSDWFTLESLLERTWTTITLWNPPLGNKDLDVILRKWKTGGFPNLERLEIHGHRFTNGTTILGMNLEDLDGKTVQTDDESKKATIQLGFRRIDISVTPF
ncbi:hypothetical protein CRE_22016 [Caenorhabditis remanei]|uniref:F-box domain-containing protein n=1 Tax=Caenorhabditis remanei TaxID=31234 RepID=E3N3E6_CAERE|nr:hypothetical protein CRE_22016 [Caenorhabditis remanei]